MDNHVLEIGSRHLNLHDIKKYWVDCESAEEQKIRTSQQENNYLGGMFSLLIAGVVSAYLARKQRRSATKKYLHIETSQNGSYCFSEDEININDVLSKLK